MIFSMLKKLIKNEKNNKPKNKLERDEHHLKSKNKKTDRT